MHGTCDAKKNLAAVIRAARIEMNLTQQELAERLNIKQRTVLDIENGRGNPKFETLYPLIRALNIAADTIFYGDRKALAPIREKQIRDFSLCSDQEQRIIVAISEALVQELRGNRE